MIGAIAVVLAMQATGAERYGMVVTRGADTVAVERVSRDARSIRSEIFVPGRARLEVAAVVDMDGCVTGAVVSAFPWGALSGGTALQRVSVEVDGDSVRVDARAGEARQAFNRAFPGVRAVLTGESDAVSATVVECALSSGANSADIMVAAFPGLRMLPVHVERRGDEVIVITTDTVRVSLGPDGRPVRVDVGRGDRVITRVDARAVDAIRFAAPDYSAPADAPYRAEQVTFDVSSEVTLAGTLTLPASASYPVPAVVTVSGSGPQDRDSYAAIAGGWRPFRQIADTLSRRGIAVLRYDDRGVGGSTGDHGAGTERSAARDALAAVAYLRSRPDIDGTRIVLAGHSEGVRIAMLAAAEDGRVGGLVLMSGAADTRAAVRAQALWIADHGPRSGRLSPDSILSTLDRQMDSLAVAGKREVYRWDADDVARGITAPVAVFHGATDRQVPVEQADSLAAVFRRAGASDVFLRVFPGLNHLLVPDESGDFLRYDQLDNARVDTSVLGALADWITSRLMH